MTPDDNSPRRSGFALSAAVLMAALLAVYRVVWLYFERPRTYDASVSANAIQLAPHVSGWVMELPIIDNQHVKKGDLLFRVDDRPYKAKLARREANLAYSRQYLARLQGLLGKHFVTENDVFRAKSQAQADAAAVDLAKLNLEYCEVRAPFDGYITNLNISIHEYANLGKPVLTLIDDSVWYVLANYREQFLRAIRPGMPVKVYVQSYSTPLRGHVEGLAWGVHQGETSTRPESLLPEVQTTLDWVILAQRFPIRVVIDERDPRRPLRIGQTAVVTMGN